VGLKITLIGSGNMATNLANAFDKAGHTINQVVSRNATTAKELASKYGAYFGTQLSELYNDSDFILLCINDESIKDVISELPEGLKGIVCHTSGPVAMDVLQQYPGQYGVFYPLQSLTKSNIQSLMNVPIFIEWSDGTTRTAIRNLADSISNKVRETSSEDRLKYHLAAVFANNFTNLMYSIADNYLTANKLDFENLLPIIEETANRLKFAKPSDLQTGPAKRGDKNIIEKHLEMLGDGELNEIYSKLSNFIMTKL
jgi:predicted short-subunit dehydrogenase-like oxidoreductase (DUF2520 family)